MQLGVIGLPTAGKTTIFNALTKGNAPTGKSMGGRFHVLTAVVDVQDSRVEQLSALFKPRKTTHARITYTDVDGLQRGANAGGGLSGPLINHLAGLDGFVHVVRAFENELFPHPDGRVDPARDLAALDTEFLLNDLTTVERRIEKLEGGLRRGAAADKAAAQAELTLFRQFEAALSDERPLRALNLDAAQQKALRGFGLLTLKPQVVVFNIDETQDDIPMESDLPLTRYTSLRGKLEMELAQLSAAGDEEALALFMAEYGITELSLERVIRLSYDLMGLETFFTVGEDEVRAWTIKQGATAVEAAAVIHTDLAKGFIRAETIHTDNLLDAGSLATARTAGKLRQEGKSYVVQDGDVINVKFNL